jgi:DNA-binding beta-propeller fold protein YncE
MPSVVEVSQGSFRYAADPQWARIPAGVELVEVAGVTTDSKDRVYVFCRGSVPVLVFDRDGTFLRGWGEGVFARPHGIQAAPHDTLWISDDLGHTVLHFTADGELLATLGTRDRGSDTGATSMDYRTVRRGGPPFHYPTNVAIGPRGDLFISDGYGNARVHRFTPDGGLVGSWGEPGDGPGQFHLPHGIAVAADGTVYVADRENSRVQLFSPDGNFLAQWTDVARPCQVALDREGNVYVAELGFRVGHWPGNPLPPADAPGGRLSVFDRSGKLLARWGGGEKPCDAGDFLAPHDVCVDSHGDLYVAEVVRSAPKGGPPAGCHTLQKFTRRRPS